ncbi:MAG: acyl carrier protein [Defluviitaleaceae bacterium]|nr:acyl carrier protein [Defluviitaleaceae bacterium]
MSMELQQALEDAVSFTNTAPTLDTMPRRTLADKGIAGPTGAHVIEEIHTPFNFAFVTITTGSTAFQNIVGVTAAELPDRMNAAQRALELAGLTVGDHILFTYPPLVNLFTKEMLESYGVAWSFLPTSSRDALLLSLLKERPRMVIGESTFLRLALEESGRLGLAPHLPKQVIFLAAGTPLDPELAPTVQKTVDGKAHDLYGCQEFGWLTLDGIPLRDDIILYKTDDSDHRDLLVGSLPTGDRFPVLDKGHSQNPQGKIITYARQRQGIEPEVTILASTAKSRDTVERTARTILRIKAKVIRVSPDLELNQPHTIIQITSGGPTPHSQILDTPEQTRMFDSMLEAQMAYQSGAKKDPTWIKSR